MITLRNYQNKLFTSNLFKQFLKKSDFKCFFKFMIFNLTDSSIIGFYEKKCKNHA